VSRLPLEAENARLQEALRDGLRALDSGGAGIRRILEAAGSPGTVHTPVRLEHQTWRVCKMVYVLEEDLNSPREAVPLEGLSSLPEALAVAICAALEEAKPGFYFIESELPGDKL
jgi:hypothetical protein